MNKANIQTYCHFKNLKNGHRSKKSSVTRWDWNGKTFMRNTPCENQDSTAKSSLLYKQARYYNDKKGMFVSQDPFEVGAQKQDTYVDGMNLYRGYFLVSLVDPDGKRTRIPDEDVRVPGDFKEMPHDGRPMLGPIDDIGRDLGGKFVPTFVKPASCKCTLSSTTPNPATLNSVDPKPSRVGNNSLICEYSGTITVKYLCLPNCSWDAKKQCCKSFRGPFNKVVGTAQWDVEIVVNGATVTCPATITLPGKNNIHSSFFYVGKTGTSSFPKRMCPDSSKKYPLKKCPLGTTTPPAATALEEIVKKMKKC